MIMFSIVLRGRYAAAAIEIEFSDCERTFGGLAKIVRHRNRCVTVPNNVYGANYIPCGRSARCLAHSRTFKRLE